MYVAAAVIYSQCLDCRDSSTSYYECENDRHVIGGSLIQDIFRPEVPQLMP